MDQEQAIKCYQIASEAIKDRDFEKAKRFLTKSIRLHETV